MVVVEAPSVAQRQRGISRQVEMPITSNLARKTSDLLKAVSDPTRLSMLTTLYRAQQPVCICDFTAAYELGQPTISHHMGKLRKAGLVRARKRGIWVYYSLAKPLPRAIKVLLEAIVVEGPQA
jgi:ArsR family transcriptional regulator, arsenate/arsenite/antimonite-responsive transcriptional repressor